METGVKQNTLVSSDGFEPSTFSLRGNCSTAELWARRTILPRGPEKCRDS